MAVDSQQLMNHVPKQLYILYFKSILANPPSRQFNLRVYYYISIHGNSTPRFHFPFQKPGFIPIKD